MDSDDEGEDSTSDQEPESWKRILDRLDARRRKTEDLEQAKELRIKALRDKMGLPPLDDDSPVRNLPREVIIRAFDSRQHALRSRATELSRGKIRSLNVTELPSEILGLLFDEFKARDTSLCDHEADECRQRKADNLERYRTVRSARLVCRLFCELGSPRMFPLLRLQVSQSSLDLVVKVSRAPHIAVGVRGILISLATWPQYLADDIIPFTDARLANLRALVPTRPVGTPGLKMANGWSWALRDINLTRLGKAWSAYVDALDQEHGISPLGQPLSEDQEILCEGHRTFYRLYQEQCQLLSDGSFAKILATAAARMGNSDCLVFDDAMTLGEHTASWLYDKPAFNKAEILSYFLAKPVSWREMEQDQRGPTELPCARMLWELPIALNKAGAPLRTLWLDVTPHHRNFPALRPPPRPEGERATWDELGVACEKLDHLAFYPGVQYKQTPDDNKSLLDNYLGSVLSRCGQTLQSLALDFFQPGMDARRLGKAKQRFYPVGALLGALQDLPCLQRLHMRGIELQQAELDAFLHKIGNRLTTLRLTESRLQNGCWARLADAMREKLHACNPSVCFYALRGGELGDGEAEEEESESSDDDSLEIKARPGGEVKQSQMMEDIMDYVIRLRGVNPLRQVCLTATSTSPD